MKTTSEYWESGGGSTSTGSATIGARADGTPPEAAYVRTNGTLACGEHAKIRVQAGDYVIDVTTGRGGVLATATISRVDRDGSLVLVARYDDEHDDEYPDCLAAALAAAIGKARCWHCRAPHYVSGAPLCGGAAATRDRKARW